MTVKGEAFVLATYEEHLDLLERDHIIDSQHRQAFNEKFPGTRSTAVPRPGLAARFVWTLAEAERLDEAQQFLDDIRARANDMLAALDDPLLNQLRYWTAKLEHGIAQLRDPANILSPLECGTSTQCREATEN